MKLPAMLTDTKTGLLGAAFASAVLATLPLTYAKSANVLDAIAIIDVTGSMNVRDGVPGQSAVTRLDRAKSAVIDLARMLPCGSRLGAGIFTERRSFLLFGLADSCLDYEPLRGSIEDVDWRMAWEGDSYVARGLYDAIGIADSLASNVIFLTDGHEAPPLPASGIPDFEGTPGKVKGLIVGVGGPEKMPIPKFDDDGREIGHYGPMDVPHVNRHGLPGKDMSSAEGWHPRNAPQGGDLVVGEEHLSAMRESYLKELAGRTGLAFVDLAAAGNLLKPLVAAGEKREVETISKASIFPGTASLFLFLVLLASPQLARWRAKGIPPA